MLQRESAPQSSSSSSSSSRGIASGTSLPLLVPSTAAPCAAVAASNGVADSMGSGATAEALHPLWYCVTQLPPVNLTVVSPGTTKNFSLKFSSNVFQGGSVFYVNPYSGLLES